MSWSHDPERLRTYKPGSIRRVKLENFLTYAAVEFCPGPRLNVVVGPNGTGKSTILCAICLGLGGGPTLLGRADDARTFIMHEQTQATIEIELHPHSPSSLPSHLTSERVSSFPRGPHILRRVIDANKGSEKGKGKGASTYYLNGSKVNEKAIKTIVTDLYGIQIDNLCTFLPQDRVGSFSGFDSQTLLKETEKSLSTSKHLYDTHMKLIDLESEMKSSGNSVQTIQTKLAELQAENNRLEMEKVRMEEREKHIATRTLLQQKQVWINFDLTRKRALELKVLKDDAKSELTRAKSSLRPLEETVTRKKKAAERVKIRSGQLDREKKTAQQSHDKYVRKTEVLSDEVDTSISSLNSLEAMQRRATKEAEDQKNKVADYGRAVEQFPTQDEIQTELKSAQDEIRGVKRIKDLKHRDLSQKTETLRELQSQLTSSVERLARLRDEKARKKEAIFRRSPALAKSFEWLESNRKMFRRPVWGPVVCEMATRDPDAASYLEAHIAGAILRAYVVECKEDYNLLFRELREKRGVAVNINVVPQGVLKPISRMYSERKMEELKRTHGIKGYLDQCFSAPDAIMQALVTNAGLQNVLVGSEQTQESLDRKGLLKFLSQRESGDNRPGLMSSSVFTRSNGKGYKYSASISRYSGKPNIRVDDITPARLLAPGIPPEQKEALERKVKGIQNEIDDLEPQLNQIREEHDAIVVQGQGISNRLKEVKNLATERSQCNTRWKNAKRKLNDLVENASRDNVAERESLVSKVKSNIKQALSALNTSGEKHNDFITCTMNWVGVKMNEDGVLAMYHKSEELLQDRISEFDQLQIQMDQLVKEFNTSKREMRLLKDKADRIAPMKDNEGNDLPLRAELEALPETFEEVQVALEEVEYKINSIQENPQVMKLYEQRKREIEETEKELEEVGGNQDAKKAILNNFRSSWEASLENTLGKVNILFGQYMKELECAGEVHLSKGQNSSRRNFPQSQSSDNEPADNDRPANFKQWGIDIHVKFRENADLQRLCAQVQSGGERAVSTIMYLMALQEMMVSPFKCVDEINQGLDERNERLVFKRIVRNSTQPPKKHKEKWDHSGQYFLITPKLLPNMTDMESEEVTLLFIFNGSYNFGNFLDWRMNDFLTEDSDKRIRGSSDDEEEEVALPRKRRK